MPILTVAPMAVPHGMEEVCAEFGNPFLPDGAKDLAWEAANIRRVAPPDGWHLHYQQSPTQLVSVAAISMHVGVQESFLQVMEEVWLYARQQCGQGASDDAVRAWLHQQRLDVTGGGYNFRSVRGAGSPSMHAFGLAIDWDPMHNPRRKPLQCTLPLWWFDIWARHGWSDGRHFATPDPMHVQFACGC